MDSDSSNSTWELVKNADPQAPPRPESTSAFYQIPMIWGTLKSEGPLTCRAVQIQLADTVNSIEVSYGNLQSGLGVMGIDMWSVLFLSNQKSRSMVNS